MQHGVEVSIQELIRLRAKATQLAITPGKKIRNPLAGGHISRFRGRGMEFEESRTYQAGDDIRSMDWRVTARTGIAHTKLFREERERSVILAVDTGATMFFGTKKCFKSVAAAKTAALLGWASLNNHDRVGALIASGSEQQFIRPSSGKKSLLHCLKALTNAVALEQIGHTAPTDMNAALARLARVAKHGNLIFLISDFLHWDLEQASNFWGIAAHNEVVAIHIYDQIEQSLPSNGQYTFSDGRAIKSIWTNSDRLRTAYHQSFIQRSLALQHRCQRFGANYLSLRTDQSITDVLASELHNSRQSKYTSPTREKVL